MIKPLRVLIQKNPTKVVSKNKSETLEGRNILTIGVSPTYMNKLKRKQCGKLQKQETNCCT